MISLAPELFMSEYYTLTLSNKSNFVYVLAHRNILKYNIYLHTIYLCRYAPKNYTCSLFSICFL